MHEAPERQAKIHGIFESLDAHTQLRVFQAFVRFREIPPAERAKTATACVAFMRQQHEHFAAETRRLNALAAQLQKARDEIRGFLAEMPSDAFDPLYECILLFRQLSATEKHETADKLVKFLEQSKAARV